MTALLIKTLFELRFPWFFFLKAGDKLGYRCLVSDLDANLQANMQGYCWKWQPWIVLGSNEQTAAIKLCIPLLPLSATDYCQHGEKRKSTQDTTMLHHTSFSGYGLLRRGGAATFSVAADILAGT